MGLPRFARNDKWRLCGHCEERSDEAISINWTFAIGSMERKIKNPELKKSGKYCYYLYEFLSSKFNLLCFYESLRLTLVPA